MANPRAQSSISKTIYNTIFKRNSIFVSTIFVSAFAFGLAYNEITEQIWENHNKGKLWKDIRYKYLSSSDE